MTIEAVSSENEFFWFGVSWNLVAGEVPAFSSGRKTETHVRRKQIIQNRKLVKTRGFKI